MTTPTADGRGGGTAPGAGPSRRRDASPRDALIRALLYPARWTRRPPGDAPPVSRVPGLERWWRLLGGDWAGPPTIAVAAEGPSAVGPSVEAWWLPASDEPGPLVVFCHGNGELIDDWPEALSVYRRRGAHLLLPEYRGFGRSAGRPSESAILEDVGAFLDRALADPRVDPARLVFHGRSLGGGVACGLARARPPRALVLQSTFTRVPDVSARWGVPRRWHRDVFDNAAVLREVDAPVFLVHGTDDRLVPPSHARALAEAAGGRAELHLLPGSHDPFPADWPGFFADRLAPFLERAGAL